MKLSFNLCLKMKHTLLALFIFILSTGALAENTPNRATRYFNTIIMNVHMTKGPAPDLYKTTVYKYEKLFKSSLTLIFNFIEDHPDQVKKLILKYHGNPDLELFKKATSSVTHAPLLNRTQKNIFGYEEDLLVDFDTEGKSLFFLKPFYETVDQRLKVSGSHYITLLILHEASHIVGIGLDPKQDYEVSRKFANEILQMVILNNNCKVSNDWCVE